MSINNEITPPIQPSSSTSSESTFKTSRRSVIGQVRASEGPSDTGDIHPVSLETPQRSIRSAKELFLDKAENIIGKVSQIGRNFISSLGSIKSQFVHTSDKTGLFDIKRESRLEARQPKKPPTDAELIRGVDQALEELASTPEPDEAKVNQLLSDIDRTLEDLNKLDIEQGETIEETKATAETGTTMAVAEDIPKEEIKAFARDQWKEMHNRVKVFRWIHKHSTAFKVALVASAILLTIGVIALAATAPYSLPAIGVAGVAALGSIGGLAALTSGVAHLVLFFTGVTARHDMKTHVFKENVFEKEITKSDGTKERVQVGELKYVNDIPVLVLDRSNPNVTAKDIGAAHAHILGSKLHFLKACMAKSGMIGKAKTYPLALGMIKERIRSQCPEYYEEMEGFVEQYNKESKGIFKLMHDKITIEELIEVQLLPDSDHLVLPSLEEELQEQLKLEGSLKSKKAILSDEERKELREQYTLQMPIEGWFLNEQPAVSQSPTPTQDSEKRTVEGKGQKALLPTQKQAMKTPVPILPTRMEKTPACTCIIDYERGSTGSGDPKETTPCMSRSMDWPTFGLLGSYSLNVLRKQPNGKAILEIGIPGMMGPVTGLNSDGLNLAMNVTPGYTRSLDGKKNYLPAVFHNREILETCSTVKNIRDKFNENIKQNGTLPIMGPYHLNVIDRTEGASYRFKREQEDLILIEKGPVTFDEVKLEDSAKGNKPILTTNRRYDKHITDQKVREERWKEREREIREECEGHYSAAYTEYLVNFHKGFWDDAAEMFDSLEREENGAKYFEAIKDLDIAYYKAEVLQEASALPHISNPLTAHYVMMKSDEIAQSFDNGFATDSKPRKVRLSQVNGAWDLVAVAA